MNEKLSSVNTFKYVSCLNVGSQVISQPEKEKVWQSKCNEKRVNLVEIQTLPRDQLDIGKVIPFIFDSGSDCSLVKESVSLSLTGKLKNCMISLRSIGGNCIFCALQLLVKAKIENIYVELLLHVVPDERSKY